MSGSKGSKGGGGWNSGWGKKGGGAKGGGGNRKGRPTPDREDAPMRNDETYQKYLSSADTLGAVLYEVGVFFVRGGPSSVYICTLPPRAVGGVQGARSDRPGAVDRFWHPQRSQMPGEGAKHIHD